MASPNLLLYGDQMLENLPVIRSLTYLSRKSALLRRFLQEATDVIQLEVNHLDYNGQASLFGFETLLSLAEENAKLERPNEIVNTTLMCIARLGFLILFAERDPTILGSPDSTIHVGLCTGLLPAAAAAVATDTSQLLLFGLEIIAISFRLTHEILLRSNRLETEPGSWSYTVIGVKYEQAQAALDDFNHFQNLPRHKIAYISAISSTWVTVSGPPSVLDRLWGSSNLIGQAPRMKLPADAAVHSSHLPELDTDKILASSVRLVLTPVDSKVKILSPCNGNSYNFSNMRDLLLAMIQDISQNHMDLLQTFQKAASGFQGVGDVNLVAIGPTAHASSMQTVLEENELIVKLTSSVEDMVAHVPLRDGSGLIAVVGMSGRFPGSESIQEFWESLRLGQEFHREVPRSRFDLREYFDASGDGKNTTSTPFGCFLDNPGVFDSRFFNVSPREAIQMDPLQRLILMASYEALEMAGYGQRTPSTAAKRISTYIGQVTDDWRCVSECQGIDIYYIPGITRAFSSGRINYQFKWEGGSYNLDTACASSSTAISLACSALLARNCDTAVAGGGSILAAPRDYSGLSKGGFLSPTGNCKTFQDNADGYCRGEGVGVVILKRLEDAILDKDNIEGVISGWARNYCANAPSITQPHADAQATLYRKVLEQACLSPEDIGYIEMHGTGTQAGDRIEMESVIDVFGASRRRDNPLVVGAVKANVGHGEAAAGVTSFIKTIMMLRERSIPPQPGMPFKINAKYPPLSKMHIRIADQCIPFEAPMGGDGKRRLLLNNFDASGGNTCLIIQDHPLPQAHKINDPRTYHIVICSARTLKSLAENQRRMYRFIKAHPDTRLQDLSYTTTARRLHHVMRRAYVTNSVDNLLQQLDADLSRNPGLPIEPASSASPVVFTFTGQGSLYPGIAKRLFESSPRFRRSLLSYQNICDSQGLPHVLDIFTDQNTELSLKSTVQIQLAITFLEIAASELMMSWGIKPSLLIGHSLGEYAALCVSGVLSITDTFYLVGRRAALLQERADPGTYAMLAVGAPMDKLEDLLSADQFKTCQVACINAPNKTVVSGQIKDLNLLRDQIRSERIPTTFLKIKYGFHSSQVNSILHDFESSAKTINFARPLIPVASTLIPGTIVKKKGVFSPTYLARQAREPVNFAGALQACEASGFLNAGTLWFEVGPEPVNLGFVRDTLGSPAKNLLPIFKSSEDNWKTITHAVSTAYTAAIAVDWTEYHKEHLDALSLLELPFYAFDLKEYWASYNRKPGPNTSLEVEVTTKPISASFEPSTSLHSLQRITQSESGTTAIFSSDLAEPMLLAALKGHLVDGTALCPASVFCDMAFTAAKCVFTKTNPEEDIPTMVIEDLKMTHPLVIPDKDVIEQTAEVSASRPHGSELVNVSFISRHAGSTSFHEHGSCVIRLAEAAKLRETYMSSSQESKANLDSLVESAKSGQQLKLPKSIVYKLFASLVDYKPVYQSMSEVYLSITDRVAAASVHLTNSQGTGNFVSNPFWIDAVIHLAGFVLNGDMNKPDDVAYISTGFKELFILEPLKQGLEYMSFTSISAENKNGVAWGDVYVFQERRLVVVCAGLSFQKMTRNVLKLVMEVSESPTTSKAGENMVKQGSSPDTYRTSVSLTKAAETDVVNGNASHIAQTILAVVALETGYGIDEMQPSTSFSDMGVDSLMSIAIVSAVKKKTGVELPGAFFQDHTTVADVRDEFATNETSGFVSASQSPVLNGYNDDSLAQFPDSPVPHDESALHSDTKTDETLFDPVSDDLILENKTMKPVDLRAFNSQSVLIQGRATSEAIPLFLIADGAGSAAAYIHLPSLPSGRKIYALESPFLEDPSQFTCSVEEVASIYLNAIRKVQPHSPYILGGWSAGAVYAYEVSRQLIDQGESVLGLILIDMRVPKPMPDGMQPTMELIEEAGLVIGLTRAGQASSTVSKVTKQHLLETVKALMVYKPIPMHPSYRPAHTCLIWAKKGLKERESVGKASELEAVEETSPYFGNIMEDPSTGLRSWFYAKRTNFGPNGWDELVGDIDVHTIDGDHFSIVVPPQVKNLGQIIRKTVEKLITKQE